MEKKSYWLHIAYHKSAMPGMQPLYSMSCVPAPTHMSQGGAMPRVHFAAWEDLETILWSVNCDKEELTEAKKWLDQISAHTVQGILLDEADLTRLGFEPEQIK